MDVKPNRRKIKHETRLTNSEITMIIANSHQPKSYDMILTRVYRRDLICQNMMSSQTVHRGLVCERLTRCNIGNGKREEKLNTKCRSENDLEKIGIIRMRILIVKEYPTES